MKLFHYLNFFPLKLCERLPNPVGQSVINCSSVADMPHITFTFGNKLFPLSPEQVCISSSCSY